MSLRLRVLLAVGVIAAMVITTALVTTHIARRHLVDQVDDRLMSSGPLGRGFRDGRAPGDDRLQFQPYYIGVVADGELVTVATPNLSGDELEPPVLDVDDIVLRSELPMEPFSATDADGDLDYRVVVRTDPRNDLVVAIGAPLDEVAATVSEIARVSWIIAAVMLAILALLAWWVLRLGVRPVKEMSRTAAEIAEHDLTARVPVRAPHTEAGELGTTLNAMLDRLEVAFDERARTEDRLRRFVGDASHELRTPVQTIRGYAELYRSGALAPGAALDDAMRRTEAEAVRMGALVDELLTLARFDQHRELRHDPVDLAVLARDSMADARTIQPERPCTIDVEGDLVVRGDEHHLRQVFANIISNALTHTPISAALSLVGRGDEDAVTITISDDGPGMGSEASERAFERFFRADESRTRAAGGSGLGLAIVQSVVEHHGGIITLESEPGVGTRVSFRIPRDVAAGHLRERPDDSQPSPG